jgi:hypothetical protein
MRGMSTPGPSREELLRRLREIAAELRAYPQPIARCDAQLGALVEEEDAVREQLARLDAGARSRA